MDTNRISIASIGVAPVQEPIYLAMGNATIEVTPHITHEKLIDTMQWCLDILVNDGPMMSEALIRMVMDFAIMGAYTNLDCDIVKKTTSEIYEDYEILTVLGVIDNIKPKLDGNQIRFFERGLRRTLKSIVDYKNSAKGILDAIAAEADGDVSRMQKAMNVLSDPEALKKMETMLKYASEIQGPTGAPIPQSPQPVEPPAPVREKLVGDEYMPVENVRG